MVRAQYISPTERQRLEAALLKNPLSIEKTFANFGLLLGIFPPAAIFIRFLTVWKIFQSEDFWILGIVAVVILISAITGYFSGKRVGRIVFELEKASWSKMLLTVPFVGIFWGLIAGGAGGTVILGIGALAGAAIGGLVGAAALPFFSIFHRLLKRGDQIENRYFLPLSIGTTAIIIAFILGL